MKKIIILLIIICVSFLNTNAQVKVGKNQKTINPSALFEMESDTSGVLMPRIALVSISSFLPLKAHVQGMVIYNTKIAFLGTDSALNSGFYYNNGTKWMRLAISTDEPWRVASTNRNADSNSQNIFQMGNIGIGTNSPLINLEVVGKASDSSSRDGVIFPKVTGDQLKSKDNLYDISTKGAIIYVTSAVTTPSAKTINVIGDGYFYFDGNTWIKLEDNVTNIYSTNGTIGSNRTVGVTDKVSFDNQTFVIDGQKHSVGIGTSDPDSSAILEIYSKNQGFLPPRMTKAEMNAIVRPLEGLIVYCNDCKPVGLYNFSPDKWVPVAEAILEDAVFVGGSLNCQSGVLAQQTGTYSQGLAMTSSNTKSVTINVVSVGKYTAQTDTVNGVSFSQINTSIFTVGAGSIIKLVAQGTPIGNGTFTYSLAIGGGQTCTFTITYTSPATFDCSNLVQSALSPSGLYMVNGTAYSQTVTVPYTAGNGTPYGASGSSSQGLTLTRVAGSYAPGGGSVVYNITGTYTGPTGSNFVSFTTPNGFCPIQVNAHSVSLVANAGTSLQMDNLKVTISTSGNRSQQIASVRKSTTWGGGSNYSAQCCNAGHVQNLNISTTISAWTYITTWTFNSINDEQVTFLRDASSNRWYRITTVIGSGYNNNLYHIERMDVSIAGISNGASANAGVPVVFENIRSQLPTAGNRSLQLATVSGSYWTTLVGYSLTSAGSSVQVAAEATLTNSFTYVKSTDNFFNAGNIQYAFFTNYTNMYKATLVIGGGYLNNLVHIEKLNAITPMSTSVTANAGIDLTYDGLKIRMASSGNRSKQISVASGSLGINAGTHTYFSTGATVFHNNVYPTITTTPSYLVSGWNFTNYGTGQSTSIRNLTTNVYYRAFMSTGWANNNNFLYIKKY